MKTLLLLACILPTIPSTTYYQAPPPPIPEPPPRYEVVMAEVSAYTSAIGETDADPFETASGDKVREGVAACPSRYEFGTKIEVEGKQYECLDRMNKRYRNGAYFDLWHQDKTEALKWGRRSIPVKVLAEI